MRLALGVALLCPPGAPGQEPPVFPSGVETVRVDVVVTDAKGRPVSGLRREDFQVREDGVPQAIVDFEAIGDAPPAAEADAAPAGATPPVPAPAVVALPASFLIVFDETHLTLEQARTARAFVVELLKTVRAGDRVTLVAAHDGRWWSGVGPEGVQDLARQLESVNGRLPRASGDELMSPYEAMRIVQGDRRVEAIVQARAQGQVGLAAVPGALAYDATGAQVQLRSRAVYDEAMQHVRRLFDLVVHALDLTPRQRGRTTLVIASGGFLDDAQLVEYRELVRRFVRSGVTAYFYDARDMSSGRNLGADTAGRMAGSRGRLDQDHERRRDDDLRLQSEAIDGDAAGAMRLADETGGFTIRVSDATGLGRLANDARHYYLLGYVPTNTKRDGALRRIAVAVQAPGASVRARKAYYAPSAKEERVAGAPDRSPHPGPPVSAPRDEAASRYVGLVESHRTAPRVETLDALSKWSTRDLRRVAMAVAADPQSPRERRWAAVVLHTDAALRRDAAGERDAAEVQSSIARELLGRVRGTPDDADFERLWFHAMGDHALELARVEEAIELFEALVARYPADAEAQLARGRAHEAALLVLSWAVRPSLAEQADLTSDVFAYNRYRRTHPGAPVLASEDAHRGTATQSFREALRLSPGLVEARLRLGRVLWLDGKLDAAERELVAVAAGPSPDGRHLAHLFLARIEDDRGRLPEALAHAEAAVALRPQWQSSRLELAFLLRRAGRGGEATLALVATLAADPAASQDGWLRYNVGAHDRAALELEALRGMVRP